MMKRSRPEAVLSAIILGVLTNTLLLVWISFQQVPVANAYYITTTPRTTFLSKSTRSTTQPQDSNRQRQHASSLYANQNSETTKDDSIWIALTREEGKNDKLQKALLEQLQSQQNEQGVEIVELPCIAHAHGPDYDRLSDVLSESSWDYIAVTSPEAARVLASAWKTESPQKPAVAVVGKATQEALEAAGIPVTFCPSKATAKVLVEELPEMDGTSKVLYPASAKAATTLQDGLTERGFEVTRLDTYDTVTATWTEDQKLQAAATQIVCVASPSSLQGWLDNTADTVPTFLAACIGETSAQACREAGMVESQIFYPDKPGITGWVDSVMKALDYLQSKHDNKVSRNSGSSSFFI